MPKIRNVIIFVCGAALYCMLTAFLYNSVFLKSQSQNTLMNKKVDHQHIKPSPSQPPPHKEEEKKEVKEEGKKEIKNPFEYNLPKHVELIQVPFVKEPVLSVNDIKNMQSGQCRGTSGNTAPGKMKSNENDPWPNFSPSKFDKETDFRKWKSENLGYWKNISRHLNGEVLDQEKLKLNELGLTLNGQFIPKKGHLPIWLRAFKRTHPLDVSLAALCKVDDISDTILYVTIDGGDFDLVFEELEKVKCTKVKVYFHPILVDVKNLGLASRGVDHALVLNSHYVYGMYMLTQKLDYPYVITIEDDLEASPDFYRHHYSLYHLVYGVNATYYDSKKIFSIGSYPHGPLVDCNFIEAKVSNDFKSVCGTASVHQLIEENYFPGWGSGITREIFLEYWSVWKQNSDIYDYGLTQLRQGQQRYTLVPCSARVRTIPNDGVNGRNIGRWDHYLSYFAKWGEKPMDRVYYVDRRDGVVKEELQGKFMYNKLVK